jgi:hypothetical protein
METLVTCKKCQIEKPHTKEFFKSNFNKRVEKEYLEKTCRECRHKRANERVMERYKSEPEFKERFIQHKEKLRLKHQNAKDETWQKRLEVGKEYKQKNKERIKERDKGRHEKRWSDPRYKTNKLFSNRINSLIKDKQCQSWLKFVDYSIQDLMKHLESKFLEGMNWNNHGRGKDKWHIDHIKPVSHFVFESFEDEQFKECWSLSNLEPKWETDNLKKGNRFVG